MRVFDMSERLACRLVGLALCSFRRPLNGDTVTNPGLGPGGLATCVCARTHAVRLLVDICEGKK